MIIFFLIVSWTINNLEEDSKSNMLQDYDLNPHSSRSIFATCSWSSVDSVYDPGAYLTKIIFVQVTNGPGPYDPGPSGPGPYPRAAGPGP